MDIKDLLALVNAGYTKAEIDTIIGLAPAPATPNPEPAPVPTPVPEEKPVEAPEPIAVAEPVATPKPQPVYTPAPVPTSKPEEPTMAQLMESIARLTSAVQANAIAQSVIPGGLQSTQNQPTAEDMLAEIIRPTFKQRGD